MLFGRACQESTIEGKLFKFHWHIERHLSSPTPPPPSPPRGTCVHARVPTRPRSSVRASRREYTMACGGGGDASETELAALLSVRPLKFLTFPRPLHVRLYISIHGGIHSFGRFGWLNQRSRCNVPMDQWRTGTRVSSPRFLVGGPYTVGGWWMGNVNWVLICLVEWLGRFFFSFYRNVRGDRRIEKL